MNLTLDQYRAKFKTWKHRTRPQSLGLNTKAPRKRKDYAHTYYLANKERAIAYNRYRYQINKSISDGLKNKPCMDCQGWFEPCQMDFDHRDPETKVADLAWLKRLSRKRFIEETKKCDVVCSNCHRLRTKARI